MEKLIQGDSNEELYKITGVDTIITDPPYGLSFMGKKWDYDVPSVQFWKIALASCKPGATALVFAGSRTCHRMAVSMEDAGWELKDTIMWLYGSGFPKATDISKQLDKMNGREPQQYEELGKYLREKRGTRPQKDISKLFPSKTGGLTGCLSNWELGANVPTKVQWVILKQELNLDDRFDELIDREGAKRKVVGKQEKAMSGWSADGSTKFIDRDITLSKTPEAKLWNGWKSHGLKPAYEPIIVAMKPNDGTYANNALKHGVSGLNIDGGRIGTETIKTSGGRTPEEQEDKKKQGLMGRLKSTEALNTEHTGRFPANIILDEEAGEMLDEQSGDRKSSMTPSKTDRKWKQGEDSIFHGQASTSYTDKGGASRFFYCAKSSKRERNEGLDSTLTVKYNSGICKEENMAVVQLLKKATYDTEIVSFNIDESGENIMGLCHRDSLSTILTGTNKTIELKTLNSLQHFITNGFIQGANFEVKIGGNPAESVESLSKYLKNITNGKTESALGVSRAVLKMLSLIKEKENWKPLTNIHSTVKPLALMEYLVKLTATPTGGKVLDPFMGSGTTGIACKNQGRDFIGIEKDEEYFEIAKARLKWYNGSLHS